MKRKQINLKRIATVVLTAIMVMSLVACGSSAGNTDDANPSGDPIRIGLSATLTGASAMEGEHVRNGVELAVTEKNAAGGLLGRPIELVVLDDQKDNTVMVNVANNLVSQEVCSVIGPATSSGALAVSQIYIDAQIPFITAGTSPNLRKSVLEEGNEWMFMCRPNDSLQAHASAAYILQELEDVTTVGMLYVNNDFGQGAMTVIKDVLEDGGIEFLAETYNAGDADVSGQILNLMKNGMEAFVFWADSDYVLVARQTYELGVDVPIVASPAATVPALRDMCEPEWIEGFIIATDVDFKSTEPHIADFVKAYEAEYNVELDLHASGGYTGALILFAAIEQAGSDDPLAIRDALAQLKGVVTPNDPNAYIDSAHCFCHQSNIVEIDDNRTPVLKTVIRVDE